MQLLAGTVRPYAWGSRTVLAELLGKDVPAPHAEAELWFGAHPADPSTLVATDGGVRSLLETISADPVGQLGAACADRWGARLPFLLKILAAEEPLSLQAHPSSEQAERGYAAEEAAGIPRHAPERNYPDPTAKPELVCALTEFHALAGFREPRRTVRLLRSLAVPALDPHIDLLAAQPDASGLRALFTTWVTLPRRVLVELLPEVLAGCLAYLREHGGRAEFGPECRTALELSELHPGDPGVLAVLLLNRLVLRPGDAIHLPAGNPHSYLRGSAVEILANSDNVLRCGLTPKHVDVPELLRVLDFSYGDVPVLRGEPVVGPLRVYPTPAEEFELSTLCWEAGCSSVGGEMRIEHLGPQIVLCVDGAVMLRDDCGGARRVGRGDAAWVTPSDGSIRVCPDSTLGARLYRATAGKL